MRAWAVVASLLLVACSGGEASTTPTSVAPGVTLPAGSSPVGDDLPRIDLIPVAVAALEERLGAPQEYFEINATSRLVNLFVALNDGTVAQAWVYLDGELSSTEGQPAQGFTFRADALDFDDDTLLDTVADQLPESALDVVEIVAGPAGDVRYTVVVTSPQGGQLLVVVGPDGAVLSVESA